MELVEFSTTSCYATSKFEAEFIYKEIFEDHCYDVPNLPQAPFMIDAGANIGLFSLYMKQKYPLSKILAFEPAPAIFDILCRNLTLHNISGVETIPFGLASKASTEKLMFFPNLPGNSTLVPEEKKQLCEELALRYGRETADQHFGGAREVDVQLQRLSHFLFRDDHPNTPRIDSTQLEQEKTSSGEDYCGMVLSRLLHHIQIALRILILSVAVLKIDVEGAELEVLRGLDDVHWALVRNIVLETCETSGVRVQIEKLLQSKGFDVTCEEAPWAPKLFYMIRAYRDDDAGPSSESEE